MLGSGATFRGWGAGKRIICALLHRGTQHSSRWGWSLVFLPWRSRAAAWCSEGAYSGCRDFSGLLRKPDTTFATVRFCGLARPHQTERNGTVTARLFCSRGLFQKRLARLVEFWRKPLPIPSQDVSSWFLKDFAGIDRWFLP